MRDKKTKILVGILLSLVVFTSSVAFLMYSKQSQKSQNKEENVPVYISATEILKGQLLDAKNIQLAHLPKSYVGAQTLTQEEILGHYATVDMLPNEPLRREKLSLKKPQDEIQMSATEAINASAVNEKEKLQETGSDTIEIAMDLFQNIDKSLQKGDYIDIASVVPNKTQGSEYEFDTHYIALHVRIASIVFPFTPPQDEKSKVKPITIAGTLVLQMEPKEIKNFLKLYYTVQNINNNRVYSEQNKGHLWMIKCSDTNSTEMQNAKQELVFGTQKKPQTQKSKAVVNNSVSIVYEK